MEDNILRNIDKDYKNFNERWLKLNFKIIIGTVILTFMLECIIGLILLDTESIKGSIFSYFIKFLIFPSSCNIVIVFIEYKIIESSKISLDNKILASSLIFVFFCFIVFTVHCAYPSLYIIFVAPLLLTSIYGKYRVTVLTGITGIIGFIFSELFISWDNGLPLYIDTTREINNFLLSLFILFSFFVMSIMIIYFEKIKKLAGISKEVERYHLLHRVQIDELTQTYNRIALRNAISEMEKDNSDSKYIFVMMDIDNFKKLNDQLGHVTGDECLVVLSEIMRKQCRTSKLFRYGGDEFSFLFKNNQEHEVINTCKMIQHDFEFISKKYNIDCDVTLSFGIAKYNNQLPSTHLIMNSDKALYLSKKVKNKITVFNENSMKRS